MENYIKSINLHVSVDCVLLGFDKDKFKVLLVRQMGESDVASYNTLKLPGSLIYDDEDLDDAAKRVLCELTGLKNVKMSQFRAYGSKDRTRNPKDILWLERFHKLDEKKIDRIVTIAYLALLKMNRNLTKLSGDYDAAWICVDDVDTLAFDHSQILKDSMRYIRHYVDMSPCVAFDLLPRKFTIAQMRSLFELIYDRKYDIRNFHKKVNQMPYVIPLEEKQIRVNHRAARFFKFDRTVYNKLGH